MTPRDDHADRQFIALVGIACRFPGAPGPEALWRRLREGADGVTRFHRQELLDAGVEASLADHPAYVPARGVLDGVETFDGAFFRIADSEARRMDPQLRLLLESAHAALEDAGYPPGAVDRRRVGIYVGIDTSSYFLNHLLPDRELMAAQGMTAVTLLNDKDFAATQLAYRLDLRGPAVNINTACSTSAVAVHQACRSLLSFDIDLALAGGASIAVPQIRGYLHEPGGILSPDGVCRPFDADARGTVQGSGVGIVALKRLEDAVAHGDSIYAVIRGSAANNDGARRLSFAAPGVDGQTEVIVEAQALAEVEPESIGYVECHGTGTALGDPIEIRALAQAFDTPRRGYCGVGSIKSNFGHLNIAAGIAGIIKAALMLHHGTRVPTLHYRRPNPEIDFDATPFYVHTEAGPWVTEGGAPRRAGVSSFGIGGTNVHLVLEEWRREAEEPAPAPGALHLLPLSARSPEALARSRSQLAAFLRRHPATSLEDAAFTLREGRSPYPFRSWAVGRNSETKQAAELAAELEAPWGEAPAALEDPSIVFLFPGQGSQHQGMAQGLAAHPAFREALDRCAEILADAEGIDLDALLRAPLEGGETHRAQPALFAVEVALVELWRSVGITPWGMIGHSLGEYTAAWTAGVFSLEDGLRLTALRGRLMADLPPGRMVEVSLGESAAEAWCSPQIALAAINGPATCVLSGPVAAVEALEQRLQGAGIPHRPLRTDRAFHSSMMAPVREALAGFLETLPLRPPEIPYLANSTGTWVTAQQACDPAFWAGHLTAPVRFAPALESLTGRPLLFLEVGPGRTLSSLAKQYPGIPRQRVVATCRHPAAEGADDSAAFFAAAGSLWGGGTALDWQGLTGSGGGRRISLPTYPFERRRHWHTPPAAPAPSAAPAAPAAPEVRGEVRFYRPGWQRADLPAPSTQRPITGELLLLLTDRGDLADALAEALEGQEILVQGGEEALPHGVRPATIVDLRGLERPGDDGLQGFYRTLATLQAVVGMQRRAGATPVRLLVATAAREAAMVPALLRVANQEHPALRAQAVEISPREMAEGPGRIVAALLGELTAGLSAPGAAFQPQVVYRAGERWVPQWETLALPPPPLPPLPPETSLPLREGGVYLLTGGLGRIGLTLAEGIARRCRGAKLALLGRSSPAPGDAVHRRLQAWREAGADVEHWRADVSSREQLAATLQEIHRRWGPVDGVIHAAGVPSREAQRPIEVLERNDCEPHFAVKVAGTRHLVELLTAQQPPPAFGVFCSSLASRLGGLGFGAYAAANAFLDSLAVQLTRQHPETRWLSVLWDGWNPVDASGDQAPAVDVLLSSRQGEEAFATLLASPVSPRVAVALGDLQHRYQAWVLTSHGTAGAFPEAAKDAPLTERILGVWRRLFGETGLKATDDFFELGGNSLLAVRLAALLEAELGLRLPVAELLRRPSVAALAAYFEPGTGRRWNPIVSIQPEAALPLDTPAVEAASQPPLICVHGAGGALLNFSPLAAALGPHHPLLGLQASGLEEGHNLFDSLESMARFYLPYLKEIGQEGPFHLLGYCFGGLVAYEIARQLTGSGATVGFLGLLDTPLPRVIAEESRLLEQDEVQRLTRLFGGRLPVQEETLRSLPADERLGHIVQQAQKASLLPPEMSDESALRYLQLFQNHLDLQIRYTPEPLKAPITFFSARQGGLLRPGRSTVEGWRTLALGDWVHHELPGDHWSMLDPPHLESLVEHLRATRVE